MRDKSIINKLKTFTEFNGAVINRYQTREGLLKVVTAGSITVKWYSRGNIVIQFCYNEVICGIDELETILQEVLRP